MKRIEEKTTTDVGRERIEERADRKSIRCILECGVGKTTGIKNKQEWGTGTGMKKKQEWGTGTGIGNKQEYSCLFPIPVVLTGGFL